jgi:hypothetical protein
MELVLDRVDWLEQLWLAEGLGGEHGGGPTSEENNNTNGEAAMKKSPKERQQSWEDVPRGIQIEV